MLVNARPSLIIFVALCTLLTLTLINSCERGPFGISGARNASSASRRIRGLHRCIVARTPSSLLMMVASRAPPMAIRLPLRPASHSRFSKGDGKRRVCARQGRKYRRHHHRRRLLACSCYSRLPRSHTAEHDTRFAKRSSVVLVVPDETSSIHHVRWMRHKNKKEKRKLKRGVLLISLYVSRCILRSERENTRLIDGNYQPIVESNSWMRVNVMRLHVQDLHAGREDRSTPRATQII